MYQQLAMVAGPLRRWKTYIIITGIFCVVMFSLISFPKGPGFGDLYGQNRRPPHPPPRPHPPHHHMSPSHKDGLSENDFEPLGPYFQDSGPIRYESVESWRTPDTLAPTYPPHGEPRPSVPHWSKYATKGEYLKQPLVADYAEGAEKIFLMIKTGADVLWKRLPIHLVTTLTRVPYFAIYADKPGSIGGYEVVDILANVTDETFNSNEFEKYRRMRTLHDAHNVFDASELKMEGGWVLDKFKNIPMLLHAYTLSPKSDWFVFMDADSFFFMDVLTSWLMTLDPEKPLYLGSSAMYAGLRFAHGGTGVAISRKALELTVGQHPEYVQEYEKRAFDNCCGDALVAQMFDEKIKLGVSFGEGYPGVGYRFQGNSFHDFSIAEDHWCHNIQSFHHVTPHEIEVLYEYERLRGPQRNSITYADMYRDFYLPYLADKRDNWDNLASASEFKEGHMNGELKEGLVPEDSFESCKEACELVPQCLSYRYIKDSKYCGLSGDIKLGRYADSLTDGDKYKPVQSGWMIDRIRSIRKKKSCDSLYNIKPEDEGVPDGSENDDAEGWYLRRVAAKKEEEHNVKENNKQKEKEKEKEKNKPR